MLHLGSFFVERRKVPLPVYLRTGGVSVGCRYAPRVCVNRVSVVLIYFAPILPPLIPLPRLKMFWS